MVRFLILSALLLLMLAAATPAPAQGFSPPGQDLDQGQNPGQGQDSRQSQAAPSPFGAAPQSPQPGYGAAPPPQASPGFDAPPPAPANQGGQPSRPNYADELTDFGVPAQAALQANVGSVTPLTIPGGHVITTTEMRQAVGSDILFIDVWDQPAHPSLPGAIPMPGAGSPGSFTDDTQQRLWMALSQATNRQAQHPMVFFCTGSRCWESYNAALRAVNMGFKMVLWYRGGLAAWQTAGLQMSAPGQGRNPAAQQPSGVGFGR